MENKDVTAADKELTMDEVYAFVSTELEETGELDRPEVGATVMALILARLVLEIPGVRNFWTIDTFEVADRTMVIEARLEPGMTTPKRIKQLEDGIRYALAQAQGRWDQVKNHPGSNHGDDVEYYKSLLPEPLAGE